jgi:hypothetical protein
MDPSLLHEKLKNTITSYVANHNIKPHSFHLLLQGNNCHVDFKLTSILILIYMNSRGKNQILKG